MPLPCRMVLLGWYTSVVGTYTISLVSLWHYNTVLALLERRRSIKIWEFQVALYLKLFEICGVLIKFLLKKWTFVAKKWRFIQICSKWRSNQDWCSICVDTVIYFSSPKSCVLFKFAQSSALIKSGILFAWILMVASI